MGNDPVIIRGPSQITPISTTLSPEYLTANLRTDEHEKRLAALEAELQNINNGLKNLEGWLRRTDYAQHDGIAALAQRVEGVIQRLDAAWERFDKHVTDHHCPGCGYEGVCKPPPAQEKPPEPASETDVDTKTNLEMADQCLHMIRETLEALSGESGDKTPPMFYPEWIRSVVAKAQEKKESASEPKTTEELHKESFGPWPKTVTFQGKGYGKTSEAIFQAINALAAKVDALREEMRKIVREELEAKAKLAFLQGAHYTLWPQHPPAEEAKPIKHPWAWRPCPTCKGLLDYDGVCGRCGKPSEEGKP